MHGFVQSYTHGDNDKNAIAHLCLTIAPVTADVSELIKGLSGRKNVNV
jgi:hypothetical protein